MGICSDADPFFRTSLPHIYHILKTGSDFQKRVIVEGFDGSYDSFGIDEIESVIYSRYDNSGSTKVYSGKNYKYLAINQSEISLQVTISASHTRRMKINSV